jgi:adenylosuccinate synthase
MEYHNFMLTNFYKKPSVDFAETLAQCASIAEQIKPMVADVVPLLHGYRENGDNLLFEGAQGAMLDVDLGTYPFVTSSNTTAGGTAVGSGFGPTYLDYVLGITKAYATRVGSGPFPTELFDATGDRLAERGHEFGSTTGRPRRCGWFDAVALRQAVQINSISGLCLTKLDVLDGLETIRICIGYEEPEDSVGNIHFGSEYYAGVTPIYEDVPGWQESTLGVNQLDKLPDAAQNYIQRIEQSVGAKVAMISTGPDRHETIVLDHPFRT